MFSPLSGQASVCAHRLLLGWGNVLSTLLFFLPSFVWSPLIFFTKATACFFHFISFLSLIFFPLPLFSFPCLHFHYCYCLSLSFPSFLPLPSFPSLNFYFSSFSSIPDTFLSLCSSFHLHFPSLSSLSFPLSLLPFLSLNVIPLPFPPFLIPYSLLSLYFTSIFPHLLSLLILYLSFLSLRSISV